MTSISDDVFRLALDKALKAQGMTKKKDRNERIGDCLLLPVARRDAILDEEEGKAASIQNANSEAKSCPSEHEEQVNFLHWFYHTYPDVWIHAIPNDGVGRTRISGLALKMGGVKAGVSDLHVPAWNCWIEFKVMTGGVWSEEQQEFKSRMEMIGHTYLLAHGCEEGKRLVTAFIERGNLLNK